MQPLQRPQPQQQQLHQHQQHTTNQLLHLQMPMESSSGYMENHSTSTPSDLAGNCSMDLNQSLNASSGSSAPSSPYSLSSVLSSASSTETNTTPPSLGVNLRVTGQCSQGGRKYMEDFFSVAYQHSENAKDLEYAFFGIFDGHGGAEAATFAKEHLMMEIINQKLFWSDNDQDVLRAIREGYIATHFAMWRDQEKWPKTANGLPSTAGTTATVAFIRHEKIYIGHVGDSGIVLGYQNEGEKFWRSKQLTVDHKPESIAERSRIMRSGGKVVVKSGVPRVVWNRPRNANHRGPIRHNTPIDEIPFLAVARSLGDLWSYNSMCNEFVVSPDPDVRVIKIDSKTFRCLVFGTDGLWNVVTPQEAVHTVYQNEFVNELLRKTNAPNETNWKNPSQSLVHKALNLWSWKKMRADNTSVVTVILHPPNGSCHDESVDNLSDSSKMENCLSDCFGMEYTAEVNSGGYNDMITYREMASKYLPPIDYQNFNYYDDSIECNQQQQQKTNYVDRYAKLSATTTTTTTHRTRLPMPTTIESLEFMCGDKEMERMVGGKVKQPDEDVETLKEIDIKLDNNVSIEDDGENGDDDDTDEDCEDMCDDDDNEDIEENGIIELDRTHEHDETTISMPNCHEDYTSHFKDLSSTNSSSSSYMSTFAESYNTLLNNGDEHMSGEVSTSNSSNSYKSHCSSSMHELMQEQQRYQQQCMSEEEGYSLTKLETRREQQRCSAGVQTFRIFQQQQSQQTIDIAGNNVSTQTKHTNCESTYMSWQRYAPPQTLELNSLLQQEREEEQQVELERQMELVRLQQEQQDFNNTTNNSIQNEIANTSNSTNSIQLSAHDVTIDEEYLVEETEDATVQINEISSSSSSLADAESCLPAAKIIKTRANNLKLTTASPLVSPKPSSSSSTTTTTTSRDSIYVDAVENLNENQPKFIEKLEEIEILHDKPELVIETTSPSITMMSTRSRYKAKQIAATETMSSTTTITTMTNKRRNTTKPHYRNIPNENQHQHEQTTLKSTSNSASSTLLRLTSVRAPEANIVYNKRQLRSSASGNNNGIITNNFNNNRKSFCLKSSLSTSSNSSSTSNSAASSGNSSNKSIGSNLINNIDYAKRTLRTRNSLSKDLKAKTTLVGSTLKRTSNVTTRFIRAQAVNILNMPQNSQIFVKKSNIVPTTTSTHNTQQISTRQISQQHHQQRPLSATTLNFINLRSRQIGNDCGNSQVKLTTQARPSSSSLPTLSQSSITATPTTQPTATSTPFIRRNLRSINGKIKLPTTTATNSTIGLPNYCKSMRSQSTASLITPPPPSPKYLNNTNSCVNASLTRTRNTNNLLSLTSRQRPMTTPTLTATTATTTPSKVFVIDAMSNRKRSLRHMEQFSLHAAPTQTITTRLSNATTTTRAPKRLKR